MKYIIYNLAIVLLSMPSVAVYAQHAKLARPQQQAVMQDDLVSRQEYDRLASDFKSLKAEMDALRRQVIETLKAQAATAPPAPAGGQLSSTPTQSNTLLTPPQTTQASSAPALSQASALPSAREFAQMKEDLKHVLELAESSRAGTSKFLLTGFASAGYRDTKNGNSTFFTHVNPVLLWKIDERILFETELELSLVSGAEGGETETELGYSHVSYLLNDYMTVGAGKFITPFNIFNERLHPSWINKLPDMPLISAHGGIVPSSSLGAYVRGAVPLGNAKGNYALYVSNGARVNTDEEGEAGQLHFDNFIDSNNNKAIGGRVGFLPIPELEIGGSFYIAQVNPDGFEQTEAQLFGFDVSYTRFFKNLGGIIDVRSEWAWSSVEDAIYDPTGSGFGPLTYNNDRWGGYVQLAYRSSGSSSKIFKNLEYVLRWDMLDNPDEQPEAFDQQRWTLGLNYWTGPSTVIKFAYRIDNRDGPEAQDADAILFQVATGF